MRILWTTQSDMGIAPGNLLHWSNRAFWQRWCLRPVQELAYFRAILAALSLKPADRRKINGMVGEFPESSAANTNANLVSRLARRMRRHPVASNRLVWAALAGTLVWFADQPTVDGYNPLFQMFWNPGFSHIPNWDRAVLLLSWLITTLFCHFLLFAFQKVRQRKPQP